MRSTALGVLVLCVLTCCAAGCGGDDADEREHDSGTGDAGDLPDAGDAGRVSDAGDAGDATDASDASQLVDAGDPDAANSGDAGSTCDGVSCGTHGSCVVEDGAARCDCEPGYKDVDHMCADIDECVAANDCSDHATCLNNDGSYACECQAGYSGDGLVCTASSCSVVTCSNGGSCVEDAGQVTCDCTGTGYAGSLCADNVDECTDDLDDCDVNATCQDSAGSFDCTCNAPFVGDGKSCACPTGTAGDGCLLCDDGYAMNSGNQCVPLITLSLVFEGDGYGSVAVAGFDRSCSDSCQIQVPAGDSLQLTATPRHTSAFIAWGDACSAAGSATACGDTFTTDASISLRFQLKHNIVFVTSTMIRPGELGSLAAGDLRCETLAAAAGLHATEWRAGLGTEAPCPGDVSGTCSLGDRLAGARGWVNIRGEEVFDQLADVLGYFPTQAMWYPPIYDDVGALRRTGEAFTGLRADGEPQVGYTCNNFTSVMSDARVSWGRASELGYQLISHNANGRCDYPYSHYCFSVDHSTELTLETGSGRVAFVSATQFTPGGGLAAADAVCQRDACDAGLTGSGDCDSDLGDARMFKAFLATDSATAASRFDADGPDYYRLDGVHFLEARTLATTSDAALPIHTALQEAIDGGLGEKDVWTGINNAANAPTCMSWTTAMNGQNGQRGGNIYVSQWAFNAATRGCQYPAHLYCFEE